MIRVLHGHRGWTNNMRGLMRAGGLTALVLALALMGCSSKKAEETTSTTTSTQPGMGENGVGGTNSLEQFKKGTLGGAGGGPLGDIHFGYNDYTIRTEDTQVLHSNADWLNQHAGAQVQIEGHCDDRGSEEYNIALGAKRAQAAKEYLQTLGIAPSRISTISYGKELPLCTEETEDCWEQNRRDHFVVSTAQ